jgi:hypothetical protein
MNHIVISIYELVSTRAELFGNYVKKNNKLKGNFSEPWDPCETSLKHKPNYSETSTNPDENSKILTKHD